MSTELEKEKKYPQTLEELYNEINTKYEQAKNRRTVYETQWYLNLAFAEGYQWVQYRSSLRTLIELNYRTWNVKHVSNLIAPALAIIKSNILATEPILHVIPSRRDEYAIGAAKISDKALSFYWTKLDMFMELQRTYDSTCTLGDCFLKPYFNKYAGETITLPDWQYEDNGQPYVREIEGAQVQCVDENNKPLFFKLDTHGEKVMMQFHTGEIEVDRIDPDQIYVDPLAVDQSDVKWMIQIKIRTNSEIKEMFGVKVQATENLVPAGFVYQMEQIVGKRTELNFKDCVMVIEYWERPSEIYPNGRVVTIAGKEVLQNIEIPEEYRKLDPPFPFIKFGYKTMPKSYYCKSPVEDARSIQKRYNRIFSRLAEHVDIMAAGKWMSPNQALIPKGYINSDTGQVVHYQWGPWGKPEQANIAPIPAYVMNMLATCKNDLYEVMAVHDISHSRPPKGVRSGAAISALQEMEQTQLEPIIDNLKSSLCKFGKCLLYIMKYRMTDERTMVIVGKDNIEFLENFTGTNIDLDSEVICEIDTALPHNKAMREQVVIERYVEGIYDRDEARKALEIEDDSIITKDRVHESKARLENDAMDKGKLIPVEAIDDHLTHMDVHNTRMNMPDFKKLPNEYQVNYQQHSASHDEHLAKGIMTTDVKLKMQARMAGMMPRPPRKK